MLVNTSMAGAVVSAAGWAPDIYALASLAGSTRLVGSPIDYVIERRPVPEIECDVGFVRSFAAYSDASLTGISLPACSTVGMSAFNGCTNMRHAYLPECERIEDSAFRECHSLNVVRIPRCKEIGKTAFYNCTTLDTVYLQGVSSVTTLGTGAFHGTKIANNTYQNYARIYVPASLYSEFLASPEWSQYSSRITSEVS